MRSLNELKISRLSFSYTGFSKNEIINEVNLRIVSGEILIIIGPSGCGKTTLLNLISNVLQPTRGTIIYEQNGETATPKFGYVFQNPSLIPWRTVKQNILIGVEISGKVTEDKRKEANDFLQAYGLQEVANSYPSILSGGMQQRVSIIRAVVSGANILLLDEPFSNTDIILRRQLQKDLLRFTIEKNLITIMVTHDLIEAVKIADQIVVLSKRPATVMKNFKIDIKKNERLNNDLSINSELYKYIEIIDHALVG